MIHDVARHSFHLLRRKIHHPRKRTVQGCEPLSVPVPPVSVRAARQGEEGDQASTGPCEPLEAFFLFCFDTLCAYTGISMLYFTKYLFQSVCHAFSCGVV